MSAMPLMVKGILNLKVGRTGGSRRVKLIICRNHCLSSVIIFVVLTLQINVI